MPTGGLLGRNEDRPRRDGAPGQEPRLIVGATHPATVAMQAAADSGTDKDVKAARALFLKLKIGERRAAMDMLAD